jgi:hypothetical protein
VLLFVLNFVLSFALLFAVLFCAFGCGASFPLQLLILHRSPGAALAQISAQSQL